MANKQIGWSTEANLLWEISKYMERLIKQMGGLSPTYLSQLIQDPLYRTVTDVDKANWNGKEDVANKSTSISADASSFVKYPSVKIIKDYVDGLVSGLLHYRGGYDASTNLFPSTGGSGIGGAIMKGDTWIIEHAGTLGGDPVFIGDTLIAGIDSPGQILANWNIFTTNIGYVPENVDNKVASISNLSTDIQYPSAKLLYDLLLGKQDSGSYATGTGSADGVNTGDNAPNSSSLHVDQTIPQTIINGIPLLQATRTITLDNQLVDKLYTDEVQSGGMKSQFFTKTPSDVVGMYKAQTIYPTNPIQTITTAALAGETIIASFIEDVNISPYRVLDGARFFHLIAKASSISKITQLKGYVYQCDVAGANPILLRTSTLSLPLTLTDAEYSMSVWGNALEIPITVRVKFVITVVKTGSGSDPDITISIDDDTFSRLDVPSPTGSTDITGLVPYTGATQNVNLGTFSLGTDEIKTDTTAPTDLILTTGLHKTLVFASPIFRDEYPAMLIPATGAASPDAVPHTIGGVLRTMYGFDGAATQEILSGSFEIPHDYMVGQPIEVHDHWRPSASSIGTVTWYFDYEYSPPNAAPIPQATLSVTHNITSNSQYIHFLDSFGNMPQPSTPFSLGGKIGFNLRRTPTTDTYGADALLEQIALHIPCDTAGSRQIYIK